MIRSIILLAIASILVSNIFAQGNDCSNATLISVTANCNNPVSGTTSGATQSFTGCVGNADDDVWYRFTASATSHVITVTGSSNFDAVVELFSGTCGSLTSLYCKDNTLSGQAETIYATGLTVGNTYYVRVYHYYAGSGSSTFTICVTNTPTPPSNDNCANAATLLVNTTCNYTNGTSVGATASSVPSCAGSPDDDVWYKFTATNSVQTITVDPSSTMDPVVELFSGTCSSLNSLYCQDLGFTDGNEVINAVGLIPGQTYYIRVYDYYYSNGGAPFQICVTGPASSNPVNDECSSAIELPEVTSECNYYYFTTINATTSSQPAPTNCENWDGSPNSGGFQTGTKDVWFKIKVPPSGILSIRPKPGYGINDAAMALYSGTCSGLTQIACSDDHNYPGTSNDMKPYIKKTGLTPGTYVYLRYWQFGTGSGDFAICVESPTNDNCSSSLYICDINGYSGSTSEAYTIDRPCNMRGNAEMNDPPNYTYTPGTCQGGIFGAGGSWGQGAPNCDVRIDNNSWIKFTASNTSVTLNVNISNCWVGNYPSGGIQMQIFSATNCCNFTPVSDFKEGSSTLTITANNLTIGHDYYLMIDGFAGDICDYSITANTGVQFTSITASQNSICVGQSVTLTAPSGATSYLWTPGGQTTQSIVVSPATTMTYYCEVTGVCGNKQTLQKTIIVNPLPSISISSNSPVCQGTTLNLTASGGSTYSWSGPNGFTSTQQNPTITNVSTSHSGTYQVTVTTSAGCSGTSSTSVTVNPAPSAPTVTATSNTICSGQSTIINASGSGATSFQVYNSSTGGTMLGTTPLNVSPTATTTYYVQAVSAQGCVNTGGRVPITITVNPSPTATASSNSGICAGQTLQLNASGGTSYQWSGPNGFTSTQQNPSIPNATTAASGTYTVTVYNSYGCSSTATTNVTINTQPTASASSNSAICSGQNLNLYASGGTSYQWSGPNGFTSTQQNPIIASATVNASGTYYVTVSNGTCSSTTSVNVVVNPTPNPVVSSNSPLCTGNTLQLFASASGTNTYQWSGPNGFSSNQQNPTIPNAQSSHQGTYYVTVTSSTGCSAVASTQVFVNTSFNTTINPVPPQCSNGAPITLTAATPGGTWSGNGITDQTSGIFNPSVAGSGTHTITYTITGSCGSSSTTNIIVHQSPNVVVQSNSPVCEGQTLLLTSNNVSNASYLWSGPNGYSSSQQNPTIPNTILNNAGLYTLTITDNNQCTAVASVNVTIYPAPNISISANNPVCSGSSLNIYVTPGYASYSWQGPNNFQSSQNAISIPNVSTLQSGTYTVTVVNSNGCSKVESIVINVLNFTAGSLTVNTITPSCSYSTNGSIQLFVTGGNPPFTYQWSHNSSLNSNTANNLSGGYYSVTITDANNCNIDTLINLTAPSAIQITINKTNVTCFGASNGSITTNVTGGTLSYTYTWNNGMNLSSIQSLGPGIYSLTVTDNNQCTAVYSNIQITEPDELVLNFTATHNQCPGDMLASANIQVIGGVAPYTYQWETGQTTQTISNLAGGYYNITVTDANTCQKVDSVLIMSPAAFVNNYIIIKDSINGTASINNNIVGGTPPYHYAWSNGSSTEDLINIEAGIYYLTVTDAINCTYIDTFDIKLPLIIPSLFTPNGDGVNDRFTIRNIHVCEKVKIEIYNRWGDRLFLFNGSGIQYADLSNQWDAKNNGKDMPLGSYVYIIVVNDKDVYNGVVSIVR